ncbi:D-aminoacyl-tRNA deacylase [Legionella impletisoli]|uniref:D-aminoacyl-tRNA deacylase n=1 Tax=Legionella impletisoli TaxID=343510 RepID=A0A917JQV8_9GAMM|nr:D-aminoacyl-tRNA deacylase [Legionella impletisoli]GGI79097.1 D-aminoacyl-tRNA deacylase [Legionella impletisoli]
MLIVIQRVKHASVTVAETIVGEITQGLLILCGFEKEDSTETLSRMLDRCLNYRIMSDQHGKMNLSLNAVEGGLLLVPQFTLLADTSRGLRPSFTKGASSEQGRQLFDDLVRLAKQKYKHVETGRFGAEMQVNLRNDGPVTFVMSF